MRSLDPRLPVLVGLGAASDAGARRGPHDRRRAGGRGRCAARRGPASRSIDRIAVPQGTWSLTDPARTVARRVGCARGPHAPVRDRRLPTGGDQPRAGGRGGRTRRHGRRRRRRGAGVGTRRRRRARRASTTRPTRCSPGRRTSWPRWRARPAWSGRPCSSTRSIENALAAAQCLPPDRRARRDRRVVGALQRGGGRQPRGGLPAATRRGGHRHAGAAQPPARLPLQPVALQPVDRQPGLRAADLLGRAGARRPASRPTAGSSPTWPCTPRRR